MHVFFIFMYFCRFDELTREKNKLCGEFLLFLYSEGVGVQKIRCDRIRGLGGRTATANHQANG